jgi:hypothetical protein
VLADIFLAELVYLAQQNWARQMVYGHVELDFRIQEYNRIAEVPMRF